MSDKEPKSRIVLQIIRLASLVLGLSTHSKRTCDRVHDMEDEVTRLRVENNALQQRIHELEHRLQRCVCARGSSSHMTIVIISCLPV